MKKKLLFFVNVDWFFISHRLPIAIAAIHEGYKVHLVCSFTDKADYLSSLGIEIHPIELSRGGTGIFDELRTFISVFKTLRHIAPDILHCVTIKPVLYGGILSRILGIKKIVFSISGLGHVFTARGIRAKIFRAGIVLMYRLALRSPQGTVIIQNYDDYKVLANHGIVTIEQSILIKGSGVELKKYTFSPEPEGTPVVSMASRLLKDKGVIEFVQAAKILKERNINVIFRLIGDIDPENPATITADELYSWSCQKIIEVLGYRSDIPTLFSKSNIIVLPSFYREGLPKVLCEAAASGRAIVTTDMPGCRDAIEPGKTGLLVPARDALSLADAIQSLIENPELRKSMGNAGRLLAEREFNIETVIETHMKIYQSNE